MPLIEALSELSYSRSFLEPVLAEAKARGIELVRWAIVQYDFAYDPQRVKRSIEKEPVFLGVFAYSADDD